MHVADWLITYLLATSAAAQLVEKETIRDQNSLIETKDFSNFVMLHLSAYKNVYSSIAVEFYR